MALVASPVVMRTFSILLVGLAALSSCKKTSEPSRDTRYDPRTDAASRPTPSASAPSTSSAAPSRYTPQEQRDMRVRVASELCETAAKHYNALAGRSETDRAGIDVISSCLRRGNNAWYTCTLQATTRAAFEECGRRLLISPEDAR